jgi:4-amino-4-deoxy-L-arabinose transferase-like glycosyltransferase
VAERIAAGWGWLTTPFSPGAPGYPVALAAVFKMAGVSWWAAVLFNTLLGAATALMLYRIGEQRLGRMVGLASALWLGASVSQIHYASLAVRDVMATFLLVWLTYSLVKVFRRMHTSVWSGFLFLLLVYTEPMFVLLLPAIVVFLGLRATRYRALNLQYMFLFIATVFVLAVPWTIRNYMVYRDFIPISLEASRYTSLAPGQHTMPGDGAAPEGAPGFVHNTVEYWRFARFKDSPGNPAIGLRPEPAWSFRHNAASILSFGILLPLLAAGIVFAWRRRHRAALVLAGIVLSHAILRGFLGGSSEARLPVEPMIILLAFYGLRELLEARRGAGKMASETA